MVEHLFTDFLKDDRSYNEAVRYWEDLWLKTDEVSRKLGGWKYPWMSRQFVDGTEIRDGNPIFSAWSPQLRKGLRVIQYEPTKDSCELSFWLDDCGENADCVQELVVACGLSDESSILAFTLMSSWVLGEISVGYDAANEIRSASGRMEMLRAVA